MKRSKILAAAFWVFVFLIFLIEGVFGFRWAGDDAYVFSSTIFLAILIFGWFLADTRERNVNPSLLLKIAVVAISTIAAPYYKFRYFGARAGFVFLAINALALATVVMLAFAVEVLIR